MKILVCFKVIYDLEHITPKELCDLRDGKLPLTVFKRAFGSYDEAALENALRIADELPGEGGDLTLHAITAGKCESRFGKELYALGFHKVISVETSEELTYRPELTAAILGEYIVKEGGYDMILMGKQAGMGESGLTPYFLAERLQMPCVSDVRSIRKSARGIEIVAKTDSGEARGTVKIPAIYTIGEAEHPYLRTATLREKINTKSMEIYRYCSDIPEVPEKTPAFTRLLYEFQEKECRVIDGENALEKAKKLWDTQMKRMVRP